MINITLKINNKHDFCFALPLGNKALTKAIKILYRRINLQENYKIYYVFSSFIETYKEHDITKYFEIGIVELDEIAKKLSLLDRNSLNKICAILYLNYENEVKYALENIEDYILDESVTDSESHGRDYFKAFYLNKFSDNKEVLNVLKDLQLHINYESLGEENLINCSDSLRITKWGLLQKL